ncbi:MAG: hypothetical protein CM15mV8_1190 [Caudoviricetes sp.]|nr:MAG: hypothetical protein CM15mV8_1190 [Caudoviricetes sp.]
MGQPQVDTRGTCCGIIPMVYKDYDSTGILVKDDWQRVESVKNYIKR